MNENWLSEAMRQLQREPGNVRRVESVNVDSSLADGFDIIVPVFNALPAVQACVRALKQHVAAPHRIWLFDDASTDPEVSRFCRQLGGDDARFCYRRNPRNLGFVGTVNHALGETQGNVVLLNSDTRVTSAWLEAIQATFSVAEDVGIVCPLSNNATLLSVLDLDQPSESELEAAAMAVAESADHLAIAIPTAVGFCMAIRRSLIDAIGDFDQVFSPGYGEEVDFSLRAWRAGFRVMACTQALVYHAGSASFGHDDAIRQRRETNKTLLNARWPDYPALVRGWWQHNPLRRQIERLRSRQRKRPLVVHLIHRWHSLGGTEIVTRRLLEELSDDYDHLVLVPDVFHGQWPDARRERVSEHVELLAWNRDYLTADWQLFGESAGLSQPWIDRWFIDVLASSGAVLLHIHHLFGWGTLMPPLLARSMDVPVLMSLHCLHYLCPDYNKIGLQGLPCSVSLAGDEAECVDCLGRRMRFCGATPSQEQQQEYLARRRYLLRRVFESDVVLSAPSRFLAAQLRRAYGPMVDAKTHLLPHGTDAAESVLARGEEAPVTVAYLSGLTRLKGIGVLAAAMQRLPAEIDLRVRVYGMEGSDIRERLPAHEAMSFMGPYQPEQVMQVLAEVDAVVIPSLFEETFSLVLSEAWAAGRAVIASDSGALAERISHGVDGWLFPPDDDCRLAEHLSWLVSPAGRSQLRHMQRRLAQRKLLDVADSASAYRGLYQRLASPVSPQERHEHTVWDISPDSLQGHFLAQEQAFRRQLEQSLVAYTQADCGLQVLVVVDETSRDADLNASLKSLRLLPGLRPPWVFSQRAQAAGQQVLDCHSLAKALTDSPCQWILLLNAGDRLFAEAIHAIFAALADARADEHQAVCFDHIHYGQYRAEYGRVFKPQFDPHWARSSSDFDVGWCLSSDLIRRCLQKGQQAAVVSAPASVLASLSASVYKAAIPALARLDQTIAGTQAITAEQSADAERFTPGVVLVWDAGSPAKLQRSLGSIRRHCPADQMVWIVGSSAPRQTAGQSDWPEHTRWLSSAGPVELEAGALTLALRAGVEITDFALLLRQCVEFQDSSVTAIGLSVNQPLGGCAPAGRVCGHAQRSLPSMPDWPLEQRRQSALRRFSQLTFDATLLRNQSFSSDRLAAAMAGQPVVAGPQEYWLASSARPVTTVSALAQLDNADPDAALGAREDPCFHPHLSRHHPGWVVDALAVQRGLSTQADRHIMTVVGDAWASTHYRVRQPLAAMQDRGWITTPLECRLDQHTLPDQGDLLRISPRVLLVACLNDAVLDLMRQARALANIQLVLQLDDLIDSLPEYHPNQGYDRQRRHAQLNQALGLIDRLVVSTSTLAEAFQHADCPVHVIENALCEQTWAQAMAAQQTTPAGQRARLRVGWVGAQQHEGDLRMIKQVVRKSYQQFDWVFFGMCPDYLRPFAAEVIPAVPFSQYPQALAAARIDIAVVPLVDNRFNRCKSALKLLEFGALGIPVVASDLEPYRGSPALLVDERPRSWLDALEALAADRRYAKDLGQQLQRWVLANHRLEDRLHDWRQLLIGESV